METRSEKAEMADAGSEASVRPPTLIVSDADADADAKEDVAPLTVTELHDVAGGIRKRRGDKEKMKKDQPEPDPVETRPEQTTPEAAQELAPPEASPPPAKKRLWVALLVHIFELIIISYAIGFGVNSAACAINDLAPATVCTESCPAVAIREPTSRSRCPAILTSPADFKVVVAAMAYNNMNLGDAYPTPETGREWATPPPFINMTHTSDSDILQAALVPGDPRTVARLKVEMRHRCKAPDCVCTIPAVFSAPYNMVYLSAGDQFLTNVRITEHMGDREFFIERALTGTNSRTRVFSRIIKVDSAEHEGLIVDWPASQCIQSFYELPDFWKNNEK